MPVTGQDVQDWVQSLAAQGLSPSTVRKVFVALTKAMKYAVQHKHIATNPCTGTVLPRLEKYEARFLTPAEVERLAEELDYFHPCGLIVRFAAYTGLRSGEVAGLRIKDVNLLRREVAVEVTRQRIDGEWITGTPKSARSRRKVPLLVDALVDDLRAYLDEHPNRTDPDAALWPGRTPGSRTLDWDRQWDQGSFYPRYFRPALDRAELGDVRFHDLRHTFASMLLAAGVEPYKVSRWMGHASITTTDTIYSHLYPSDHSVETARMQAYLGSGVGNAPQLHRMG